MIKRDQRLSGFWGIIFLAACLLCLCAPLRAAAESGTAELYRENLRFDSQGNLRMTTRDKKAEGGVRYRTIGWVMRRTKETAGTGGTIRLKLEEGISRPDPNDPGYVYTYFKCERDLIFAKIGAASADWQMDLYQNGGYVYLDAIMTVVENGVAAGRMEAGGVLHGEVYTTAAGIMNARDWADPQALLTHYGKAVYFPAVPELLAPAPGEDYEEGILFRYGQAECGRENKIFVRAPEEDFDVAKGIPTGEELCAGGQAQKYYYEGVLRHYYGTAAIPVEVEVTYSYPVETEEGVGTGYVTKSFVYPVERAYSYYRIERLSLFRIRDVFIENGAFPVSPMELRNVYVPRVTLEQNRDSYMELPRCRVSLYGGSLLDGGGLTAAELEAAAEQAAGDIWVRNDAFFIDGEMILDGSFVRKRTREMEKQSGARLLTLSTQTAEIPHTKRNDVYETYASAVYEEVFERRKEERAVTNVNAVTVHTPVVCKGGVTDDIAHNQQVVPTSHFSLILGRNFEVGISTFGKHKEQPGYGVRDYGKYTKLLQVCFPFEVYDGGTWIAADRWIDLTREQKRFYLPPGVHEGDYRVRFRTVAKNADAQRGGIDRSESLANRSMENYVACDALTVTVVGRMYDLAITDIVDYPRWKSVFYEADGSKKRFAFWIGGKNLEGQTLSVRAAAGRFPVLQGAHPYNRNAGAPGLGYRVRLQLKTVGDMRAPDDKIVLFPTYYYISRDGRERRHVRLYRRDDLTEVEKVLTLGSENRSFVSVGNRNVSDAALRARSVQIWDGEYQLSPDLYLADADVDLDAYIRLHGGRIRRSDPVFLRDGYLLVRFEVRSFRGEAAHLSYANAKNSARGYCNMWRMQGFLYDRTDGAGNVFSFVDGDCLLFDTKYSLHSDYESWGTH